VYNSNVGALALTNVQALSTPCVNKRALSRDGVTMQSVWWLPYWLMCSIACDTPLTTSTVILQSMSSGRLRFNYKGAGVRPQDKP
jgi:hypothetical protein